MGYKTRGKKWENLEIQGLSNSFCPILGPCSSLGAFAYGNLLYYWSNFCVYKDDKTNAYLRTYGILGPLYLEHLSRIGNE